jgi:hypothetical protein
MDLQRSSWLLELQQVYVLLSSFVPLIMLWDPCAFISISHNAVGVSCNMDNSIWIKNATQHNPGMKFWQKEHIVQLCFHLMLLSRSGGGGGGCIHSLYLFGTLPRVWFYYLFKNEISVFIYITWASWCCTLPVSINHSIDEKNELIL